MSETTKQQQTDSGWTKNGQQQEPEPAREASLRADARIGRALREVLGTALRGDILMVYALGHPEGRSPKWGVGLSNGVGFPSPTMGCHCIAAAINDAIALEDT